MSNFISYFLSCYKLFAACFWLYILYNFIYVSEENINILLIIIYSLIERVLYLLQLDDYDKLSSLNVNLTTLWCLSTIIYGLFNFSNLSIWYLIFIIIYIMLLFLYFSVYYGNKENDVGKSIDNLMWINKKCPHCFKKLQSRLSKKCPHCTAYL